MTKTYRVKIVEKTDKGFKAIIMYDTIQVCHRVSIREMNDIKKDSTWENLIWTQLEQEFQESGAMAVEREIIEDKEHQAFEFYIRGSKDYEIQDIKLNKYIQEESMKVPFPVAQGTLGVDTTSGERINFSVPAYSIGGIVDGGRAYINPWQTEINTVARDNIS